MASLALVIERAFSLANGYWVPMTALIILKPQARDTATRTAERVIGTLAGGALATFAAAFARPGGLTLSLIVIALTWLTYALQRVNYAVFPVGITATVVFLLSLTGLPEPEVAWRRVAATMTGAVLAVVAGGLAGDGS
jgi:uncharacterized membrane protein YccC